MNLVNRYRGTRTPAMEEYAVGKQRRRRWMLVGVAALIVVAAVCAGRWLASGEPVAAGIRVNSSL